MRISAVVPVRDGERYLGAALASLRAQTRPPDEVVVVDDGSSDAGAAVARAAGARVVRLEGEGPGVARNAGVAATTGDAVAFLDADDLAVPRRVEAQRAALEPGVDAVFGAVRAFLSPDRPELAGRIAVPATQAAPHVGTMLIRRTAFEATGGFDSGLAAAEFIDWLDRARAAGLREVMLPAVLLERRIHGGNLTLQVDRGAYAQAARAAILRRRNAG